MKPFSRRNFFKFCGAYVTALTSFRPTAPQAALSSKHYNSVKLMRNGRPMRSEDFEPGQVFIFHYPYVTTPCFIFNLGESQEQTEVMHTKNGSQYLWHGGIGPSRSIVAYSAICAHRMTYPAKSASFLNYRHSKVVYFDGNRNRQEREKIIYCCSERSVYDPAKGAQVIGGPAPQPLATINLEYKQEDDSYFALGTSGGDLFNKFLSDFEFRLQLDFQIVDVKKLTVSQVDVQTIEEFSQVIVHC